MAQIVVPVASEKLMKKALILAILLIASISTSTSAEQRRGGAGTATGGAVTFAVAVQDPAGTPVPEVKVTVSGAASRTARTEGGRIVFEGLPAGTYKLRFEKDGYITYERELAARGSTPIDVKVTLDKMPAPPPPPAPVAPVTPKPRVVDAKVVAIDMPAFIEKYYVGRAAGKTNPLGCATGGDATLLQLNESMAEHTHDDADEFFYVIAGQGAARLGERVEALGPGVFMLIPRGTAHTITPAVKKPLEILSLRAGAACSG
jgi:mannose-6-phosphate isomerase-like protein (cupin superfamily)